MSNQATPDSSGSLTALGAELKAARERRSLSLHQASQELHIGDWILDALEQGDYSTLGAPIFVRGHLRAYARLLGLGEEQVLAQYEQETDKPMPPPLVTQKLDGGMRRASAPIFSVLVIVVLCSLAIAWWVHREQPASVQVAGNVTTASNMMGGSSVMPPAQTSLQKAQPAAAPAAKSVAPVTMHATEQSRQQVTAAPPQQHVSKPIELPPAAAPQVAATSVPKTSPPPVTNGETLTHVEFTLNQASWIEVYDAGGKRLYYDLAPAGENVKVSGAGPLQVFLGNAPGVSIQLNGTKFDQSPYTRTDNTARFRLGGTGNDAGQTG
ncbi:MAG: RodZ domain-containing protein [Gammaproteobacteria bacterium]